MWAPMCWGAVFWISSCHSRLHIVMCFCGDLEQSQDASVSGQHFSGCGVFQLSQYIRRGFVSGVASSRQSRYVHQDELFSLWRTSIDDVKGFQSIRKCFEHSGCSFSFFFGHIVGLGVYRLNQPSTLHCEVVEIKSFVVREWGPPQMLVVHEWFMAGFAARRGLSFS